MSGAAGRAELRASAGAAGAVLADVGAGAVGGPIEIACIAGRERPPELGPTSIGRVTTTAGAGTGGTAGAGLATADAAAEVGVAAAGAAAADTAAANFPLAAPCCGADAFFCGCATGAIGARCADFVDGGAPFGAAGFGCWGAPAPRPSFGGRCIVGPSSDVFVDVDVASASPLGLPGKSLEKTLIAED